MKKIKSFLALDFEYLVRGRYDTACSVGLVKVIDGVVVQKMYTLIRPSVGQGEPLAPGNGITWEMVQYAPTFAEVYPLITGMAGNLTLVAHNFSTERKVLTDCCASCGIEQILYLENHCDTCLMTGNRGLEDCCQEFGIPIVHHNALSDAEACAYLFMHLQGEEMVKEHVRTMPSTDAIARYKKERESCDLAVYRPLSNEEVQNKNTPFYGGVKTVVTGTFEQFPDRNQLKQLLKELGADIEHSMGKKTQILVAGQDAGPAKMKQAVAQGTRVMMENELLQVISGA